MSGVIESKYGAQGVAITATAAATLANNGQASTAFVDNTANLYLDALIEVDVTVGTNSGTPFINVYVAASLDGGTVYGGGEASMGTDHTVTLASPPNIVLLGIVNTPTNTTGYKRVFGGVAAAFGGTMPDHWCLVLENKTGGTLTAATVKYQGVMAQTT